MTEVKRGIIKLWNIVLTQKRFPLWFLVFIGTILFTGLGFLLGVLVHPFLLLLLSSVPVYPLYLSQFKIKKYRKAMTFILVWAVTISIMIILLTWANPSLASRAVLSGTTYQEEMFLWIASGVGAEGDASTFVPTHLVNATVFSVLSLATGGILALLFGAYQMNYMNYYVSILLSRVLTPTFNNLVFVALLSWPIYALIRVAGFIFIGVATTIPFARKIFDVKENSKPIVRFLLVGTIFILVDIVIKFLIAPIYRDILLKLVIVD